jgi:endonuclease-3
MSQLTENIITLLDIYVPNPKPPLKAKNPFTFLIAVLLSARCTDERVNQVTEELFSRADTPQKMSKMPQEEIERIIHPCGLFAQKAKAILALSKMIIKSFDGKIPTTIHELESLPGVGHKTASVVLCQLFSTPAFPVDTHIFRIARRWGLSEGKTVRAVENDLKKMFPEQLWGRLHLQMILYARRFCPAKNHKIENCPICLYVKHRV